MSKFSNKWTRAAIPALLLHGSIGTVYCWTLVKDQIAEQVGSSKSSVEWAFSLAIFFLGMSAAFAGNVVEKDIHKSSLIAAVCFSLGMAGTGFFIAQKSLIGIFLSYGVIMGIGLGFGYLSPVKTLMLWFKEQKGLATGLAVAGFGAAKVIASPIMEMLMTKVDISTMFYILAAAYFVMMFIGHLLLKKPDGWVEEQAPKSDQPVKDFIDKFKIFGNKTFLGIWLMFFINITCGLAIISQEKSIVTAVGLSSFVGLISSFTAVFNAAGRLGFSAVADKLKDRNTIFKVIFALSIVTTVLAIITGSLVNSIAPIAVILLFVINAGYGGGFSNIPTLLSDHFGMKTISAVHGIALSAWAFAGLAGNQMAAFIVKHTGQYVTIDGYESNPIGYQNVLYVTGTLYILALVISYVLVGKKGEKIEM